MIGEGVKQIPSYVCKMPYDKLNELREQFWNSRKKYRRVWKAIREICESDSDTAVILLEAAEMACKDDLRQIIVLQNPEYIFRVPNYCICDPVFERDYDQIKEQNKDIIEANINLKEASKEVNRQGGQINNTLEKFKDFEEIGSN